MRPQEPSVPPFRSPGAGDEPRRAGRAPAHARPDDDGGLDDPYGDVPAPPRPAGVQAPYGASGWSGSDHHVVSPPDHGAASSPPPRGGAYAPEPRGGGGPGQGPAGPGGYGNGHAPGHGYGLDQGPGNGFGAGGHGPGNGPGPGGYGGHGDLGGNGHGTVNGQGPYPGAGGPQGPANGHVNGPVGPVPGGPGGWPAAPVPGPAAHGPAGPPRTPPAAGGPRPDAPRPDAPRSDGPPPGPPAAPDAGNGHAARPPTPPAPPAGPAQPSAGSSSSSSASPTDAGGLAGSDGFASRPPKRDGATTGSTSTSTGTTATTAIGRGAGAGAGPGRHRRAGLGPADEDPPEDDEAPAGSGPGRSGRRRDDAGTGTKKKKKRKGSFWRELPLLIVVAVVLTFVIQTFLARIYVIPSASMERTLHGCNGCANDRVAVDKLSYRFTDPSPGDVVVFRGPPSWGDNGEVSGGEPSGNVLVRGLQSGLSLVGLAPPNEKDFVKRVIAVGGQTVACCDAQNRVTVDGRPLTEPYIYYQPNLGRTQADFAPVRVPEGQLWVMGDNRNNSADARVHGPIGVTDVIGKARVIVLPVGRWGGVPDTDPQAQPSALGAPGWTSAAPLAAGALVAVPLVGVSRRLRRRWSSQGGGDRGSDDADDPDEPPADDGRREDPPPSLPSGR